MNFNDFACSFKIINVLIYSFMGVNYKVARFLSYAFVYSIT
jgi:hypothetical protein